MPTAHQFRAGQGNVNAEHGTILGVSLIEIGEAKGHFDKEGRQVMIDGTTLDQVLACATAMGSLKVRLDHGSGVASTAGYIENFRREGDSIRGDLSFYDSEDEKAKLLEIAAKNPEHLGLSLEFGGEDETSKDTVLARCSDLIAVALVSDPAATKSLFSQKSFVDTVKNSSCYIKTNPPPIPTMSTPATAPVTKLEATPAQTAAPTNGLDYSKMSMKECEDAMNGLKSRMVTLSGTITPGQEENDPNKPASGEAGKTKPPTVSPSVEPAVQNPGTAQQKDLEARDAATTALAVAATIKTLAAQFGIKPVSAGSGEPSKPAASTTMKDFETLLAEKTDELGGDTAAGSKAMQHLLSTAEGRAAYVEYRKGFQEPRKGHAFGFAASDGRHAFVKPAPLPATA
jgi:hypothetical protein